MTPTAKHEIRFAYITGGKYAGKSGSIIWEGEKMAFVRFETPIDGRDGDFLYAKDLLKTYRISSDPSFDAVESCEHPTQTVTVYVHKQNGKKYLHYPNEDRIFALPPDDCREFTVVWADGQKFCYTIGSGVTPAQVIVTIPTLQTVLI